MVHVFANEGGVLAQIQADEEADWTPFGYAQRFPEAIPTFDYDFNKTWNDYLSSHQKEIQADYTQFQKAENKQAQPDRKPLTLRDFEELPAVKSTIQGAVLRHTALVEDIKELQQGDTQIAAKIAKFLVKMELSLHFLTAFANTPNDEPHTMTPAELSEYNVTNTD